MDTTIQVFVTESTIDGVIDGSIKSVRREIRPQNAAKLIEYYDEDGTVYPVYKDVPADMSVNARPIAHHFIEIINKKTRKTVLAECKEAKLEMLSDEYGNVLSYRYGDFIFAFSYVVYYIERIIHN